MSISVPAAAIVAVLSILIVISSDVVAHIPYKVEMVQRITTVLLDNNPVIDDVGLFALLIVAVPLTTDHVPVSPGPATVADN